MWRPTPLVRLADQEMISAGRLASLVKPGGFWFQWRLGAAIGRSDKHFYSYTETENIKHFGERVISKRTVRMLAGRVVATGNSA